MLETSAASNNRAWELHNPVLLLFGHRLRMQRGEAVDQLTCLTCGIEDWHRWTPFTGGTWVGPSPALDLYAGEHHRPEVLLQALVVRDVLTHVGAPPDHIAGYELLAALTTDKVTSTNLFRFLTGDPSDVRQ